MLINGKEVSIAPEADLSCADLRDADLRGADLSGTSLRGADLSCADLRGANLSGASLRGADLSCANLRGVNLRGVNLRGANLRGVNLSCANLPSGFKVCRMDFGGWSILVLPLTTTIGCQTHKNEDWLRWTPEDVSYFAEGAKEYWSRHRESICAVIRDVMGASKREVL
jgi:hypothetical protein